MILQDYHVHTLYSPDSKMEHEEAIRAAMAAGVTEICFTDYMDLGHHMEKFNRVPDFQSMEETIAHLRNEYPELIDRILSEIIKRGKGIEVNTSGINRAGHVLPHPSIIRRYRELGGRIITIGSDAHRPENVSVYAKEAVRIIAEAGFQEITLFRNREPRFVTIC